MRTRLLQCLCLFLHQHVNIQLTSVFIIKHPLLWYQCLHSYKKINLYPGLKNARNFWLQLHFPFLWTHYCAVNRLHAAACIWKYNTVAFASFSFWHLPPNLNGKDFSHSCWGRQLKSYMCQHTSQDRVAQGFESKDTKTKQIWYSGVHTWSRLWWWHIWQGRRRSAQTPSYTPPNSMWVGMTDKPDVQGFPWTQEDEKFWQWWDIIRCVLPGV
jgi:hypothetical protein